MSAVDPIFAVLGRISQDGKPPCRVWQVGEGVSPTLDANERIGGLVSASRFRPEAGVDRNSISYQLLGSGLRSMGQVTTAVERSCKATGAGA